MLTIAPPCCCIMLFTAALHVNIVPKRLVWIWATISSVLVLSNKPSLTNRQKNPKRTHWTTPMITFTHNKTWLMNGILMVIYTVLHIPVLKMMTLQGWHIARKKVSYAFDNKASFAKRYQTLVWTISEGKSGRNRSTGGTHKLRIQKLQWKLYPMLEYCSHQEQNIGECLILFSAVLFCNSLTKYKGP